MRSSEANRLTYEEFKHIFDQVTESGRPVGLHLKGANQTLSCVDMQNDSLQSFCVPEKPRREVLQWYRSLMRIVDRLLIYLEDRRQHIFIIVFFYAICSLLFAERFYHYYSAPEYADLRRVMGIGICFTRGAAAPISFTMGVVLLTVLHLLQQDLTALRSTFVAQYVPLDAAIPFHKIVALTCAFFAAVHTVGHCINFFNVATQSRESLDCLFPDNGLARDFQPTIAYWLFGTMTGFTGVLLVAVMVVIYVFSTPPVIRGAYPIFRLFHMMNILFYVLTVLHGLARLTAAPRFGFYVCGPIALLLYDWILGRRKRHDYVRITDALLMPSNVVYIRFERPADFEFVSGQWVGVEMLPNENTDGMGEEDDDDDPYDTNGTLLKALNKQHAFSLASSPQDNSLALYIKAIGPWTWRLYNAVKCNIDRPALLPMLRIDGPYGAGNQEWTKHAVAVMVGGGIGVTPYASILREMVYATHDRPHRYTAVQCKKVYFLWVCGTHRNYDWFVNVLRNVEAGDTQHVLEVHVFLTQYFHKFDLRTTMLYICERHFRAESGRSMFTNLRAVNHFGRPNLPGFLRYVQQKHPQEKTIGVFSCGPSTLNSDVARACRRANDGTEGGQFIHRYETF